MTDGLAFTDQSALELRLNVIEGAVEREQLSVLTEKEIENDDTRLWVSIIGASHAICITTPSVTLSEVFACSEIVTQNRIILSGCLSQISGRKFTSNDDYYSYSFQAKLLNWEDIIIRGYEEKAKKSNAGLVFNFPTHSGDSRVPKTIVMADIINGIVHVESLHAYPNEDNIVISNSQIRRIDR